MMQELLTFMRGNWSPGAYGIWVLVAMFGIYLLREWRETRKLSSADRQARREGFEHQVDVLMHENRRLGEDLRALRHEYDNYRRQCLEENDQRVAEIRRLENELHGLQRQMRSQAQTLPRVIEDQIIGRHTKNHR